MGLCKAKPDLTRTFNIICFETYACFILNFCFIVFIFIKKESEINF